ncbi:MAG TPA: LuxR C-terminal-related transcriptional regulator [Herpetosiphonaceae bacterium]
MDPDQIFNLISFLVGLGIGLFQLYIGQRQFEDQQRDRMTEIQKSMAEIEKRIAILQEVTSQRSFDMQDKLLDIATKDEAVAEITAETSDKIQGLIAGELRKAGVQDALQKAKELEVRLDQVIGESATSLANTLSSAYPVITNPSPDSQRLKETGGVYLPPREQRVLDLTIAGKSSQDIADELGLKPHTVRYYLHKIYQKHGVNSRDDLLQKVDGYN